MRVSDFPNVLEQEPNDVREKATATALPLPVALNGVIEKDNDEDWFRFKAKKGETYEIRAYARGRAVAARPRPDALRRRRRAGRDQRRPGRPRCLGAAGGEGDAEYELRIRDHLHKGGPAFVYRIEFNTVKPAVYTHIPAYDREPRDQIRQWIVVPKGNRFATWIRTNRQGFNGDLKLTSKDSPKGSPSMPIPVAKDVDRAWSSSSGAGRERSRDR
jgi:hypothetical protein